MPATEKFLPSKRRLTLLFFIVILLSIFFFGFGYYYVPSNKDGLNKYAFLILENVKTNIQERNKDNINRYINLYKNYVDTVNQGRYNRKDSIFRLLLQDRGKVLDSVPGNECTPKANKSLYGYAIDSISGKLENVYNETLIYSFAKINKAFKDPKPLIISVPAEKMLTPIFETHQKALFRNFLLLKICGESANVVYKDTKLNIGKEIFSDSLWTKHKGAFLSGTRDIAIDDISHKMFYLPLDLDNKQLILCGFIKTKEYNSKTHQIPVGLIYPIVILLLLFIIALPLIKIYLLGKNEQIKLNELVWFTVSVFIGSTLITIIIIQVILLKDGDIKAKNDLDTLSQQIESAFLKELNQAYTQLDVFDSLINSDSSLMVRVNNNEKKINLPDTINHYFSKNKTNPSVYYNFDRIAWVDTTGQQFMKAQFKAQPLLFTNVSERNYYQLFEKNEVYYLPGHSDSIFAMEPVYNWINGEFRFIISKKSRIQRASIVTISTKMQSVTNTILPAGYGFCIIDNEGNVQVHSEKNRNLNENFLEQSQSPILIREAIESRQQIFSNSMVFYGKKNALHITPLPGIPFYLITYYDKGYIVPINIRILIFSVLFSLVSYVITLIIWLIVFWRRYYTNPFLYSPMGLINWIIPKRISSPYYLRCIIFLVAYLATILLLTFIINYASLKSNYFLLLLILITPINIVAGLIVIIYSPYKYFTNKPTDPEFLKAKSELLQKKEKRAKEAIVTIFAITVILFFFTQSFKDFMQYQFITCQSIFIAGLTLYYFNVPKIPNKLPRYGKYYRRLYAVLVGLLIIGLAVLPAALFSWYPHNQEIIQSVKNQQVYFAKELQNRKNDIKQLMRGHDINYLPVDFYEDMQYRNGIYTIYKDTFILSGRQGVQSKFTNTFENFYFEIANNLSYNYYNPRTYIALQDSSTDGLWHWSSKDKRSFSFWYTLPPDISNTKSLNRDSIYTLEINSKIPDRFIVLSAKNSGLYLLTILCICLLWGLYKLIRSISESLFLQKYLQEDNIQTRAASTPQDMIELYLSPSIKDYKLIYKIKNLDKEFNRYMPGLRNPKHINYEKEIIMATEEYRGLYDFIWNKCSGKEKYLLYNFARYGLMNFKNTVEIYLLLQKKILIIHDEEIKLFSVSFRAYVLRALPAEMVSTLNKKYQQNSAWHSFRTPFLIILLAIAAFIFFTQENTWQRIIALITGISSSIPFLLNTFSSNGSGGAAKK